tara:strand:- start:2 stop:523 length:522 start_codon:yes stop_codon:yes gene_type:complete
MKNLLLFAIVILLSSCGKDSSPPVITSDPYIGITELIPEFQIQNNTFLVGETKDIIISVKNIGDVYSEGSLSLYVTGYPAFNISFSPTATTANTLVGTIDVQNQNWASFKSSDFMYFETPLSIAEGDEINISIRFTAREAGQLNALSVALGEQSGGDINPANNVITKVLITAQ